MGNSNVAKELARSEEAIQTLFDTISRLESEFRPILAPDQPEEKTSPMPAEASLPCSDVTSNIRDHTARIERANRMLLALIERNEL